MFNYNHLFYFYITAKLGGVTTAAKHLNTSQSSLSLQLKTLEESLNQKLFQKVGRQLRLTAEGRVIFNHCQRAFHATEDLADFLKKKSTTVTARLGLGVSDELDRTYITDLIASSFEVLREEDRPAIKMISLNHHTLAQKMNVHELDLFLTNHSAFEAGQIVVAEESLPVVLVGRPNPVFQSPKFKELSAVALLRQLPQDLILPASDLRFRLEVDQFILKHRIEKRIIFESNIMASLSRAIVDGLGIGFLPLTYIMEPVKRGRLVLLSQRVLWHHHLFLVASSGFAQEPFTRELAKQLRKTAARSKSL